MLNLFQKINNRISRTSFILVIIVIQLFFWINGKAFFPNWDSTYGDMVLVYIAMTVIVFIWAGRHTRKEMERPIGYSMGIFAAFFIITYMILAFSLSLSNTVITPMATSLFWPAIILQVCVIATPEEMIFRGVLLERFGLIPQAVLFAVWHSYAYSIIFYMPETIEMGIASLALAFFMGIVFGLITRKFGLAGAIASHAAYNLTVTGAFITWSMM